MGKTLFRRLLAALLALALLAAPAAALTPEEARQLLADNYVDPVPQSVLDRATIDEMLEALGDPYTEYFTASEYQRFLASMADSTVVGIGVLTTAQADGLLIDRVYADSPAERSGLRAGDLIVAVDGQSLRGLSAQQSAALLRGEAGSQVSVTYLRDNLRRGLTLTRAAVVIPATDGEVLEGRVGYISCTTWGDDTLGHFRDLIAQMDGQVSSWLVDLRGNGGGTSQAAADTAGLFCGRGDMLYLRFRDESASSPGGYSYSVYGSEEEAVTDKPLVVLVDGGTASASEAFCAAIRDHSRGVIVGSRTFGKGIAQGLWDSEAEDPAIAAYFQDGDALKITMARFFSPAGNTNDTLGVMPDLLVDDAYAADVGWLLASGVGDEGAEWLFFPWELTTGQGCWVCLDHLREDETWRDTYAELLNALAPDVSLALNSKPVTRSELAQRYGLTLTETYFPDLSDSKSPYALAALKTYGLVNGKDDGLFHPQDGLTRAELCQMLYNALNCWDAENGGAFTDVSSDAWYSDAVTAMWKRGLVAGVGEDRFDPEGTLDCQQLITILGRLARWLNDDLDYQVRAATAQDMDYWTLMDYDDWAVPSAWLLGYAGPDEINLLWADPEDVVPTAPATRDQAAILLYDLLYYLDVLP